MVECLFDILPKPTQFSWDRTQNLFMGVCARIANIIAGAIVRNWTNILYTKGISETWW